MMPIGSVAGHQLEQIAHAVCERNDPFPAAQVAHAVPSDHRNHARCSDIRGERIAHRKRNPASCVACRLHRARTHDRHRQCR